MALDEQINHLKSCQPCRMLLCSYEFHSIGKQNEYLALEYFVRVVEDGIKAYNSKTYLVNGVPFVNTKFELDNNGGMFVCPGKGQHAVETVPGSRLVKMRPRSGQRNSSIFILFLFLTKQNASKGEFYFSFNSFYSDAGWVSKIINLSLS